MSASRAARRSATRSLSLALANTSVRVCMYCARPVSSIEVRPVAGRGDLRRFIRLPFRLHSTSQQWVPPLILERRIFLSRRLNAYFKHGEAEYFLAWRGDQVVGRITAQIDRNFNAYHSSKIGHY